MPETIDTIAARIQGLTMVEAAGLVKLLEQRLGVSVKSAVATGPAPGGPAVETAPAVEEKTEFTVTLTGSGTNKIGVIKAVRELTKLGLKEAKDLVDTLPKPVKEGVSREEADAAREKLTAAGATVELQ